MADIKLKFTGTEPISKDKPFEASEFLYFTTEDIIEKNLPQLIQELKGWNIDEHHLGDAYFVDAVQVGNKIYFSLRMNYRTTPPLTKDESKQLIYDIIESFNLFLNEIEWLKHED